MTALSPETRRLLQLSRGGDDPSPAREKAVRDRLIAQLGASALAGVATASAIAGAANATGAAAGSAAGSTASLGATTAAVAKALATLILAAGLGVGALKSDALEQADEWPAAVAVTTKHVAERAWRFVTGAEGGAKPGLSLAPMTDPVVGPEAIHQRLIAIARRPNRPVAKEAELILILGAEQALEEGDHERAARYLDAHEARFANDELRDDREKLRALCEEVRHGGGMTRPAAPAEIAPSTGGTTNF